MAPFSKILVAARGAAALRTVRTARSMGYRTVAVFGPDDAEAPHVATADQAVAVDPAAGGDRFPVEAILDAARKTGADAIHPARGTAARNHALAAASAKAGLTFVGPPPETIRLAEDNRLARLCARGAGIAVIPGYDDKDQADGRLEAEARRLGYPVVVKPACGDAEGLAAGDEEGLAAALSAVRKGHGGDRGVVIETFITDARRIDMPIFADSHGNVVYLAERDHAVRIAGATLVAETPSPAVDPELRERLGAAAVALAGAIDYVGAGTIQFLLDTGGRYYFLGMTPELSLGHALTEMVSGIDLVAWQIKVAAGEPLPLAQHAIPIAGHAVAGRLHAEAPGRLLAWAPPSGAGIRADHAIDPGRPLALVPGEPIADLAAYGTSREEARRRLAAAAGHCVALGVPTNRDRLVALLEDEGLAAAAPPDRIGGAPDAAGQMPTAAHIALAAVLLSGGVGSAGTVTVASGTERWEVAIDKTANGFRVSASGRSRTIAVAARDEPALRVTCDGIVETARAVRDGRTLHLDYRDRIRTYRREG